ncbi:bifunctional DNA-formamidopyrimidine glycosylase/DNA-(apurinic or apyrimidinic site) lyase [Aquella oligotrophica]|uniref:Formamidopyrimidine-DNA glycosylase n=1 Tax=Aquella oligotrophica TaxID=2067065 RepID=A0A2I7N883_9NEIS|nr:bifunctional DNA-formamidopyrimidine glycosylase/DNA-(apurinic or apyrimidinic site) lyase [Aquella oligotrophica]AUR52650.1 DNA-formamidopyrimidine glycosylase [Aquella oligotrophica]
MPELPEVETIKNGLIELTGTSVKKTVIRFPRLRYPLNKNELSKMEGQKVQSVERRAKYLLLVLEKGTLIIHLGMSGRITLYRDKTPEVQKHDHVDIQFNGYVLRYNDPRRFGCIVYTEKVNDSTLLVNLGPEPFNDEFNPRYLKNKIANRKTPIKQLIMDNAIVVGVGNIYACESLFMTKISPLKPGNNLTLTQCADLVKNIQTVLQNAINAGGSSLRDYKNANGDLGYFQISHYVYGRANLPCKICNTPIREVRLGQRNSFFCPECQK